MPVAFPRSAALRHSACPECIREGFTLSLIAKGLPSLSSAGFPTADGAPYENCFTLSVNKAVARLGLF